MTAPEPLVNGLIMLVQQPSSDPLISRHVEVNGPAATDLRCFSRRTLGRAAAHRKGKEHVLGQHAKRSVAYCERLRFLVQKIASRLRSGFRSKGHAANLPPVPLARTAEG